LVFPGTSTLVGIAGPLEVLICVYFELRLIDGKSWPAVIDLVYGIQINIYTSQDHNSFTGY
jgi:hypothetical protein